MMTGRIPSAKAELAILAADHEARPITHCGHGKSWDEDCPDCVAVWRDDQVRNLVRQAGKYGFKLVLL